MLGLSINQSNQEQYLPNSFRNDSLWHRDARIELTVRFGSVGVILAQSAETAGIGWLGDSSWPAFLAARCECQLFPKADEVPTTGLNVLARKSPSIAEPRQWLCRRVSALTRR